MTPALATIDGKFSSKYRTVAGAAFKKTNNQRTMSEKYLSRCAFAPGLADHCLGGQEGRYPLQPYR